ncbi:MAG: SUMF1/EgtB/PvdO family nonheme iron enzyme [Acidobacteriota bacterium]
MICTTCNLHYPEHLNFCRRCGNTLTESMDEPAVEAPCCTRCGARFVPGENFCQQCGYKLSQRSQETVVGGCYGCGTPWRSGWLYCRKCGLDRDQALMGPLSASADGVSKVAPPGKPEEVVEDEVEKVPCPVCNVTIKPYSRFCEACGGSIAPYSRPISAPILDMEAGRIEEAEEVEPGVAEFEKDERAAAERFAAADREDAGPATGIESAGTPAATPPAKPRERLRVIPIPGPIPGPDPGPVLGTVTGPGKATGREPEVGGAGSARRLARISGGDPAGQKRGGGKGSVRADGASRSSGNAAWQAFGIVSVVLIILGLLASWWVLRAEPSQSPANRSLNGMKDGGALPPVPSGSKLEERGSVPVAPEGMVYVAGGLLRMGRENGDELERPVREVEVRPFFMDLTEVTNEMYLRYVRATGATPPAHWIDGLYRDGEARFPVVNVSWNEANGYAAWANKRLPTEAEWEMAARGTAGRLYPWGDVWKEGRGNVRSGREARLVRVGSFPGGASPDGILDLSGNVWEWTADKPMRYGDRAAQIAEGRIIRGGAYDVTIDRATATYRGIVPENRGYDKTGFRCVRDPEPPASARNGQ